MVCLKTPVSMLKSNGTIQKSLNSGFRRNQNTRIQGYKSLWCCSLPGWWRLCSNRKVSDELLDIKKISPPWWLCMLICELIIEYWNIDVGINFVQIKRTRTYRLYCAFQHGYHDLLVRQVHWNSRSLVSKRSQEESQSQSVLRLVSKHT